jgi:4a-hydroxytetrahydrobiopterin dehydratase
MNATYCELAGKNCKPCEGGVPPLTQAEAKKLLEQIEGWALHDKTIDKTFEFKNYYQTMAFVNAAAWVSHREDHHPDITVGYNKCRVEYSTHAIGGLSENDFICAAKVDALLKI